MLPSTADTITILTDVKHKRETTMSKNAWIRPMLDLSTSHITRDTAEAIELHIKRHQRMELIVYPKGEDGWIVYVPPVEVYEELSRLPEDLKNVIAYARWLGCDWVMFDRDGNFVDGLPTWSW